LLTYCAQLSVEHRVEGLRTDILLVKTAKAYAALEGRTMLTQEDIQAVQALVLEHRSNRSDNNNSNPPQQDQQSNTPPQQEPQQQSNPSNPLIEAIAPENDLALTIKKGNLAKKGETSHQSAVLSNTTLSASKALDKRKTVGQYLVTDKFELKQKGQQSKVNTQLIFLLDSSGSMLQQQVVAYAKGILKKWAEQQGSTTTAFSLISLFAGEANLSIEGSKDINVLLQALETIQTGGKTNVIAGLKQVKKLTTLNPSSQYQLIVISDGRFQSPTVASVEQLVVAYKMYCKRVQTLHFVDTETDVVKIGWGRKWSEQLNGTYEPLNLK